MIAEKSVILQRYRSPCGEMMLGAIGDSICLCGWIGRSGYERDLARVTKHFGACVVHGTCPVIDIAAEQLDEYFSGKRKKFNLPVKIKGTDFQKAVYNCLLEIPYGKTKSYKEIADIIGHKNAYRAVGSACNKNKILIVIPCHRVIASNKGLAGFALGLDIKKQLLKLEGAEF